MADAIVDLRSDTVTKPSPGMRTAMQAAEVGDDVFGDDPTVNRLQERVAAMLGKEAALFVPSGTMSNQIAVRIHTQPGDELLCDATCHIYNYEAGGPAALSGVMCRTIDGDFGVLDASQFEDKVRPDNEHLVRTRLVCLENTHNRGGGRVYPLEKIREISAWFRRNGLATHLDGAALECDCCDGCARRRVVRALRYRFRLFQQGPRGPTRFGTCWAERSDSKSSARSQAFRRRNASGRRRCRRCVVCA